MVPEKAEILVTKIKIKIQSQGWVARAAQFERDVPLPRYLRVLERGGVAAAAGRPVGCGIELARSSVLNSGLTQSSSR